jgi:hypothetical protein
VKIGAVTRQLNPSRLLPRDPCSAKGARPYRKFVMRAELEKTVGEIEQVVGLLRRHL